MVINSTDDSMENDDLVLRTSVFKINSAEPINNTDEFKIVEDRALILEGNDDGNDLGDYKHGNPPKKVDNIQIVKHLGVVNNTKAANAAMFFNPSVVLHLSIIISILSAYL